MERRRMGQQSGGERGVGGCVSATSTLQHHQPPAVAALLREGSRILPTRVNRAACCTDHSNCPVRSWRAGRPVKTRARSGIRRAQGLAYETLDRFFILCHKCRHISVEFLNSTRGYHSKSYLDFLARGLRKEVLWFSWEPKSVRGIVERRSLAKGIPYICV